MALRSDPRRAPPVADPRAVHRARVRRDAFRDHGRHGVRPHGRTGGPERAAQRRLAVPGHRWERLADAVFYGVAASVVLVVVASELTGTVVPAGNARGVLAGGCVVVTLVVGAIVARRR